MAANLSRGSFRPVLAAVLAVSCYCYVSEAARVYAGFKLLRLESGWRSKLETLLEELQNLEVDIWNRDSLLVSPEALPGVEGFLTKLDVGYSIVFQDVQRLIQAERQDDEWKPRRRRRHREGSPDDRCGSPGSINDFLVRKGLGASRRNVTSREAFENVPLYFYLNYCQIRVWLNEMATRHPDVMVVHEYGRSYENRSLVVVKVGLSTGGENRSEEKNRTKPIVWVDGGIHAREWISVSSSLFLIHLLVTKRNIDPHVKELLHRYIFYVAPLLNPDGYEFSFDHDRFWRKTRCLTVAPKCKGVDANRNYNFYWGGCKAKYRRNRPQCESTYAGKRPFSEPETHSFARFFWSVRGLVKVYLSLHTFGNIWFVPYGYSNDKPKDYEQLFLVSEKAAYEIWKSHGSKYEVGTPGDIIYSACGGSFDWVKGRAGVKYSFTMEVGNHSAGFTLPPRYIVSAGVEVHTGLSALLRAIEETDACWMGAKEGCQERRNNGTT